MGGRCYREGADVSPNASSAMTDALRRAMHANHVAAQPRVASIGPQSVAERVGPWLLVDTARPDFAAASRATVVEHASVEDLRLAIDWFEARGMEARFQLRDDEDGHLIVELERRGYARERLEPALLLRSAAPPRYAGPLAITEVSTDEQRAIYGPLGWTAETAEIGVAIAQTAHGLGFTMLLGALDGEPIASSMAAVTGAMVGVYNVSVAEPFRRRGFGEAMSWAAVAAGIERGAADVWVGSSAMGYRLYRRMGFSQQYEYIVLAPPG